MTQTRDLTTGLQHRELGSLEVREGADGAREGEGIGVPYNTPIEFMGVGEQFAPGAIEPDADVMLSWRHRDPIGRVVEHHNGESGWYHRAVISQTPAGDEAYTLARDGVIDRFSVGFEPIESVENREDDGTLSITHTKVRLREVSLVPFPAYDDAELVQVREQASETTHLREEEMETENLTAEVGEIRAGLDELTRKVEMASEPAEPEGPVARSFGDFV